MQAVLLLGTTAKMSTRNAEQPTIKNVVLTVCSEYTRSLQHNECQDTSAPHPKVQELLARPRIAGNTPDWHHERRLRITGTNVSSILYDTPQTALELFRKKTGQVLPMTPNEAMRYGIEHEAEAADVYAKLTGLRIAAESDIGLIVHRQYPDLAASPDRVLHSHPILVEIKCPYKRRIQQSTIPLYYIPQVQMQLEVCDMDTCHFVQYKPATRRTPGVLDVTVVYRDRLWWQHALPHLFAFRDAVHSYYRYSGRPIGSDAPDAEPEQRVPFNFFKSQNLPALVSASAADDSVAPPMFVL